MSEKSEKVYQVTFSLTATENGKEIINIPVTYSNASYVLLVTIEQLALRILNLLGAAGVAKVVRMGQGDKLEAFGIPTEPPADDKPPFPRAA